MSDKPNYTFRVTTNGFGIAHEFVGPSLPRFANTVNFIQQLSEFAQRNVDDNSLKFDAERVRGWLEDAYQAGRDSMAADVRRLLGATGVER